MTPTSSAATRPVSIAALGECMLELQGQAFGTLRQTFGGDTLNTAVYLARCGGADLRVHYATALGDDSLSAGMLERWQAEGVLTGLVQRLPGRVPGLYLIELDEGGERRFHYWRGQAAARAYFDTATTALEEQADALDALYLSGISLAISLPMIAGIIWKVEALPTPLAKNSTRNEAKKPQNAYGWSLTPMK